jgi:hypothetical protein
MLEPKLIDRILRAVCGKKSQGDLLVHSSMRKPPANVTRAFEQVSGLAKLAVLTIPVSALDQCVESLLVGLCRRDPPPRQRCQCLARVCVAAGLHCEARADQELTIVQPSACGIADHVPVGIRAKFAQQTLRATFRPKRNQCLGKAQLHCQPGSACRESGSSFAEQMHGAPGETLIEKRVGARQQQLLLIADLETRDSRRSCRNESPGHAHANATAFAIVLPSREPKSSSRIGGGLAATKGNDDCVLPVSALL